MRLLNVNDYCLEEFFEPAIPKYAILSHRWSRDEVLITDIEAKTYKRKKAFEKVRRACEQAFKDGFNFVWIDTCCINKSSSAELSEAINSMFRWYREAAICYAFLSDFDNDELEVLRCFDQSKWFKRGWTLQELIAPERVIFFDKKWRPFATRHDLREEICRITKIGEDVLRDDRMELEDALQLCTIAQRMSWAAFRKTTRIEDRAYSLMGLFSINMPLLYGEGRRAFARLQEEILKQSTDLSILAWDNPLLDRRGGLESILARTPDDFAECSKILFAPSDLQRFAHTTITMTNAGLRIERPHLIHGFEGSPGIALSLECRDADDITQVVGLKLQPVEFSDPASIDLQQQQQEERELLCYVGWKDAAKAETRLLSANFSEPKRLSPWSSVTISREFKIVPSTHQSPMTQQLLIPSIHTHVWVQLPRGDPLNPWVVSKLYREEFWNVQDYTFQFDEEISADVEPSTYSEEWSYGAVSLVEDVPVVYGGSSVGVTITFARKLELRNNERQSEIYLKLGLYHPGTLPRGENDFVFGDLGSAFSNDETHSLSIEVNRKFTVRVESLHRLGLCIAHLLMHVEELPGGRFGPGPSYRDAEDFLMMDNIES